MNLFLRDTAIIVYLCVLLPFALHANQHSQRHIQGIQGVPSSSGVRSFMSSFNRLPLTCKNVARTPDVAIESIEMMSKKGELPSQGMTSCSSRYESAFERNLLSAMLRRERRGLGKEKKSWWGNAKFGDSRTAGTWKQCRQIR
ncbi:hypothetical protein M438DRAFT_134533 [Aureobasidium pullulans EXF-150]|uniref:Uncharacterized protein n=1 Tax=Aureobasidium pullulans EXF-150 TaxID=1043002 RepID=A0A074XW85_AURPU|nr:uncharacterized protein M438DRAFT_134533 [Aureobasidium pullulans EXF-150]KEQ87894.1 hypothetical protein M438DRAFT_134533 [Aureobasidium pullulans EXF-150]